MSEVAILFCAKQAWVYSKIAYVQSVLQTGFLHNLLYPDVNQCSMIND